MAMPPHMARQCSEVSRPTPHKAHRLDAVPGSGKYPVHWPGTARSRSQKAINAKPSTHSHRAAGRMPAAASLASGGPSW